VTCSKLADQKDATFFNITELNDMLQCDLYFEDLTVTDKAFDYDIESKDAVYLSKNKPLVVDGAYFFNVGKEITLNQRYFDNEKFGLTDSQVVFVKKGETAVLPFIPKQIVSSCKVVLKNKDEEELVFENGQIIVVCGVVRSHIVQSDLVGLNRVEVF
jgi:hypothetical protein